MHGLNYTRAALAATALGIVTSLAAAAATQPAALLVEIRVEGNKQTSANAVLSNVKSRLGEPFDETVVKADEKRLLQTGRFATVATRRIRTDKGVVLIFDVTERPLVAGLEIKGNKAIKTDKLRSELSFGPNDPLSDFAVQTGRQALLNAYHGEGYYFAEVAVDKAALARRQVIYQITEGPQVRVRKIRFEGNTFFNSLILRFKISSHSRLWPFFPGNLDNEQIDQDVVTLRNLYVDEGFLDAKVSRRLDFSPDKNRVTLTFIIDQGPRYRVNTLLFRGNQIYNDQELANRLKFRKGEFFTAATLKQDTKAVQDSYGELGFIEAQIVTRKQFLSPETTAPAWAEKDAAGRPALVNLVFDITENDQYRVGKIDIRGNSLTQSRVIRRELRFFPEQLFNTVAVEESRKRLEDTRLFEKVTIAPVGRGEKVRDALVQVQEGKTAEFMVGVGVSSNNGLLGNVTLTQRNFDLFAWPGTQRSLVTGQAFKGAGQTLSIVAEPGNEMMRFHIDWEEPYLFDQPYRLANRVYYFERQRETYDEIRYGDMLSVGHRFANRWYGEIAGRAEGVDINDLDNDAPPEVIADQGSHFLTGPKFTLVRDTTDSRWTPTTGDVLRVAYEQILGSYTFGRATGDYHIYRTVYTDALDRKHVLSGKVQAGQIFGDAPVFEKFYGGGMGSVRGFKYRGISPRSKGTDEQIGGDWMFLLGTEYEYPLIGEMIRGVLFIDTGTVEEDFGFGTYRASVGTGIRWVLPLFGGVPMSFDFGFPIVKDKQDDTQIFSFNVGVTF